METPTDILRLSSAVGWSPLILEIVAELHAANTAQRMSAL